MATVSKKRKGSTSPLQRGLMVAGGCVLVGGLVYLVAGKSDGGKRRAPAPQVVNITVPPPPPPPPPPPRPKPPETTPPPETAQQMVAETAEEPTPAPAAAPSNDGPLGTGIKGDGAADGFGLGTGPGGGGGTGTRLAASGGGTRWAGYSGTVKKRISDAISADPRTRFADGRVELGLWFDAGGRITRVALRKSTLEAEVEEAMKADVLVGLQIQPPPADMPQPIWLRTSLRRPN
jgi:outer membrane biosynthesis protein TonB